MSKEVKKYDSHRFDDLFYAHSEIFLNSTFMNANRPNIWNESDFDRISAFPVDVVRPFMERLLKAHGEKSLLHTIMAVNFECVPIDTRGRNFGFIQKPPRNPLIMPSFMTGLVAACGMDLSLARNINYVCNRCRCSIRTPEMFLSSVTDMLRNHVGVCEMSIDMRYFKPLTDFREKSDHQKYINFLHKSVTETVLRKQGLLMLHPHRYDKLPFSVFISNRHISLNMVLCSRKRYPRFDNDALNRIAEAGYHVFPNPKEMNWKELTKELSSYARRPISENKIMCFSCHHEVTMSNEFISNPWRYHAQKSPKCNFLVMKKGKDYIKEVQESTYNSIQLKENESTKAVIDPRLNLKPPTSPIGEVFDFCKIVTSRKLFKTKAALSLTTLTDCIVCSDEMCNVLFMPCLHIAACVDCSFSVRECPLCRKKINAFMMPLFKPDGSFWMQPKCIGGNYFMNLPCRHLVETCVPNNVDRCPKANAVEKDKIYCVVCGKMNMAKIRVYL